MSGPQQSRAWMLTLPADAYSADDVREALGRYDGFIGQLEQGDGTGYLHWQLYMEHRTPIRFTTLRKLFPRGHFEARRGTRAQAVAYVTKSETAAGETLVKGDFDTSSDGTGQGARSDLEAYQTAIMEEGLTPGEVVRRWPAAARFSRMLDTLAAARDEARYGHGWRDVEVHYLWGAPGAGKTRSVVERYGWADLFRVTSYEHPFDLYRGQKVLVLDEFTGQLPLDLLLNILDGYPLLLPARYADRWAAYSAVWIISNVALEELYRYERRRHPARWDALRRRIGSVEHLGGGGPAEALPEGPEEF